MFDHSFIHWPMFFAAALVLILSPNSGLAFLLQFVADGAGPAWAQLALHAVLILAVSAFVTPPLNLLSARFSRDVKARLQVGLWIDRVLGANLALAVLREKT